MKMIILLFLYVIILSVINVRFYFLNLKLIFNLRLKQLKKIKVYLNKKITNNLIASVFIKVKPLIKIF